jgi:hypothetical protein
VADPPPSPWTLPCPWCEYEILVFARGGRWGAGEEAAEMMKRHVEEHEKTWPDFLAASAAIRRGIDPEKVRPLPL